MTANLYCLTGSTDETSNKSVNEVEAVNDINETSSSAAIEFGNKIVETGEKLLGTMRWHKQTCIFGGGAKYDDNGDYIIGSKFCMDSDPLFDDFELQSGYEQMCLGTLSGEIKSLICWELYGYLLLKSGILNNSSSHNRLHEKLVEWSKLPANMNGNTNLDPGDLIFMNGSNHAVLATGKGDQVLSIWEKPKHGICLTTLKEIKEIWPIQGNVPRRDLKIALSRVPVGKIYTFLQSIKEG
jgi:hypothetical protein